MSAYIGGTRGSGALSSARDVQEMSVVRGVGGVCDMVYVFGSGRGGVGGEWIVFGLYQSRNNMGKVGYGVGGLLGPGSGRVVCYYVCVCCESGFHSSL